MSGYCSISLWCYLKGNAVVMSENPVKGTDKLEFIIKRMDCGDRERLEENAVYEQPVAVGFPILLYDEGRMRLDFLRNQIKWCNIMELHFKDGRLDDDSWSRLVSLRPEILRRLAEEMQADDIGESERQTVARQCVQLFGKAGSVNNPHPSVALYCELSQMWEKFGLNYFDLMRLPLKLRNQLRNIMSIENKMTRQSMKENAMETRKGRRR